jgi:2-keto-4-pentenoate hydratase/2-oxohepta-3-ene-1,7-dioic acid hydratase in catechol pathway
MKLLSYLDQGAVSFGAVDGAGKVIDLREVTGCASLKALIASGGLDDLPVRLAGMGGSLDLDALKLLPVIPDPGKIICIGMNYHDHVVETGREVTENPTLFNRYPASQVGHGQPMVKPQESDMLDYEGEMALVIGRGGRRIPRDQALAYVAGYSCYNDGSVRDWQRHTSQFMPGKNFVATGGFGPWMVTPDEVGDPTALTLVTRLNKQEVQRASTSQMITPMDMQIAYISTFIDLEPGDVIVTGTPGGVGARRTPPVYMRPGDVVEVEIERVGLLRNPVVAE